MSKTATVREADQLIGRFSVETAPNDFIRRLVAEAVQNGEATAADPEGVEVTAVRHETKSAHYSVFGVSVQPSVADASGYLEFRDGFERLPEAEWTTAERWIAEREAELSAWRQQ